MRIGIIGLDRMGGNICQHNFGEKILSVMRFGFGGHVEGSESIDPEPKPKEERGHSAAQDAAE